MYNIPPDHEVMLRYFVSRISGLQNVFNEMVQSSTVQGSIEKFATDDLLTFPFIAAISQRISLEIKEKNKNNELVEDNYMDRRFGECFAETLDEIQSNPEITALSKMLILQPNDSTFMHKVLLSTWMLLRHEVDKENLLWLRAENQAKRQFEGEDD